MKQNQKTVYGTLSSGIGTGATAGSVNTQSRAVLTQMSGNYQWADIEVGRTNNNPYVVTCGVTVGDGVGYCWGMNNAGGLGNGDTVSKDVPTQIYWGHSYSKISPNYYATCGIIA